MSHRFTRMLITAVCLLSILAQTIGGGLGASRMLCVGCDGGGWTINAPNEGLPVAECCGVECHTEPFAESGCVIAHGEKPCGCIVVPLSDGIWITTAAPRSATAPDIETVFVSVIRAMPGAMPIHEAVAWSRAGPSHPPRLLTPRSRFTVLVV